MDSSTIWNNCRERGKQLLER